jgi:hypothetical protein
LSGADRKRYRSASAISGRLSGPSPGTSPGSRDSIPPPAPGAYGPPVYPPGYYPPPPPKGSNLALIIVIVVIAVVLVTVILAAVLYIMVSGLIQSPSPGPRVLGVNIGRSGNQSNWTLLITSTPSGLTTSTVTLTIWTPNGSTALGPIGFTSLTSGSWSTNHAEFVGTGGTTIVAGDQLLISTSTYPAGYSVQIADSQAVLYAHALS